MSGSLDSTSTMTLESSSMTLESRPVSEADTGVKYAALSFVDLKTGMPDDFFEDVPAEAADSLDELDMNTLHTLEFKNYTSSV
jgi:hypothetical protein